MPVRRGRVDRLARAAGGDEDLEPVELATGAQRGFEGAEQLSGLRQAAGPVLAQRRERPGPRLEHSYPTRAQTVDVLLGGRMLVHRPVHGRSDDQRSPARQCGRRQQVVGVPVRELGECVGRRRGDHERVGPLDQLEVRERGVLGRGIAGERAAQRVALPLGEQHRRAGDAGERCGADEAGRRLGLDHADRVAGLDRQPRQLERLICRDAAADAEQEASHGTSCQPR